MKIMWYTLLISAAVAILLLFVLRSAFIRAYDLLHTA